MTSEEAITLANNRRCERTVRKKAMPAVTATANQKRTAIGSVKNSKTNVAQSNANAMAILKIHRPSLSAWRHA